MKTVLDQFLQSVERYPQHDCLLENLGQGYHALSYTEVHRRVVNLSAALIAQGIHRGDRVAILSENRLAWTLTDLAILHAGAIVVTLSTKLIENEDLLSRLQNSGAETIFVSASQRDRIMGLKDKTSLRRVICFDDADFDALEAEGSRYLAAPTGDTPEQRNAATQADDPAVIIYTSGTTGNPKGVVLTHRNNVAHAEKHRPLGDYNDKSCTLALLPLDHCLFHSFFYMAMANGASIAMPQQGRNPLETMLNMTKNIQETHPDILVLVPAMLQGFKLMLHQKGIAQDPQRTLEFFGGRLRYLIAGGALTDPETERFFLNLGLPIHIGYGMTEATAGVSRSYPGQHRTGTVGRPASLNQEVLIVDEEGNECAANTSGEILYRGETVMQGYWQNPEATREVLTADGWFHTGDMGHLDDDGFLYIDGRVKSLLISNSGEKYSPEGIESTLIEACPLIQQIMLYNQQSPCTIALIVPRREALAQAIAPLSLDTTEGQDAAITLLQQAIATYRKGGALAGTFPDIWLPATFALLHDPFSVENGQLTATQKLARHKVAKAYSERIASLFTPAGMNPHNDANRNAIRGVSLHR